MRAAILFAPLRSGESVATRRGTPYVTAFKDRGLMGLEDRRGLEHDEHVIGRCCAAALLPRQLLLFSCLHLVGEETPLPRQCLHIRDLMAPQIVDTHCLWRGYGSRR